jgi:hypothetical protein
MLLNQGAVNDEAAASFAKRHAQLSNKMWPTALVRRGAGRESLQVPVRVTWILGAAADLQIYPM